MLNPPVNIIQIELISTHVHILGNLLDNHKKLQISYLGIIYWLDHNLKKEVILK